MLKRVLFVFMASWVGICVCPNLAPSEDGEAIRRGLQARLTLSHMEVSNPALEGHVFKPGAVLVLQVDGVPANKLRVIQANTKSPRFHVRDYAQVTVATEGTLTVARGDFLLSKGTRLGVLDLKVEKDRIRVFTHTLAPLPLPDGKTAHGCTEFVFALDPAVRDRGDVATVAGQINRLLSLAANG